MKEPDAGVAAQGGPDERTPLACVHCGKTIAWCSFCDETDCADPSCYPCLVVSLGESIGELHVHGG